MADIRVCSHGQTSPCAKCQAEYVGRASVAPQGDALHWQLKAGVAETMCGVAIEAEEGIRVTYRCQYTRELPDLENGLALVDLLTPEPDKDVTRGLQEMELLADYISADVDDAIKALATPVTAPVSTGERSVDDDPLTDAEVDAWLKAHKDEPVDPARASRIEWLFRKKLAASIIDKAKEWLRSYDERIAAGGKGAQNMERLYGEEAAFHREVIRALETLAL